MKKRDLPFIFCLLGSLILLGLGLIHWLFWIAMVFLLAAAFLLKK